MLTVVVRSGHAKPLWVGHPWVHAASVLRLEGEPDPRAPDVALVVDADGKPIGRGFLAPDSALRVRLLEDAFGDEEVEDLLTRRIREAMQLRQRLFPHPSRTNAYRLVHAEGDRLPGLIVDRYGDLLVAQFATAAMHRRREALAAVLLDATGARSLRARPGGYETEEGIPEDASPFVVGDECGAAVTVLEEGMRLAIDPIRGQKTGHYADQRENRRLVADLARGRRVLDLFAGTAGFSIQALRHGAASALAVEVSSRSSRAAETNASLNGVASGLEVRTEDARRALVGLKERGETFEVVVLDPPNFFPRRGNDGGARKAHRDLSVQAIVRTQPGGILATFCCSARMTPAELRDIAVSAGRECRRRLQVLRVLGAGPDHPVLAAAPEGRYLSGLLLRVLD